MAWDYRQQQHFHTIAPRTSTRRVFWLKIEKSKFIFWSFQALSTQIILKIKKPKGSHALKLYGQIIQFLSPICEGVCSGINWQRKPFFLTRNSVLKGSYSLTYPPRNNVHRMGTYQDQVLSLPISNSLNSCKFSQNWEMLKSTPPFGGIPLNLKIRTKINEKGNFITS